MSHVELYDIIALKNGKDYTVLRIKEKEGKMYFLLARIDENEKIDMSDIRIVEEIEKSGKKFVKEIDDEKVLEDLSNLFSKSISELNNEPIL